MRSTHSILCDTSFYAYCILVSGIFSKSFEGFLTIQLTVRQNLVRLSLAYLNYHDGSFRRFLVRLNHSLSRYHRRLQYSFYAGRHVVPREGLLIECTADMKCVEPYQSAFVVINSQVDNKVPCQNDRGLFLLK